MYQNSLTEGNKIVVRMIPLDLPFTHLLSVILNSRYFKLFLFPLTVQNNGVQLYDYDYKNKKKFVPGEGIPLPTKEFFFRTFSLA